MTKQNELDVIKTVNTNLRWSIGLFTTLTIFLVSMKIAEVRSDATFKGEVKTEIINIKNSIDELKKDVKDKSEKTEIATMAVNLKETKEDLKSVQFFLKAKFDYKPIERSIN